MDSTRMNSDVGLLSL